MLRYGLPLGVFLALVGLLAIGLQLDPREVPSPLIDQPAPALGLPKLDQPETVVDTSDLAGEVWMLNVWASWCVACRQEHPLLNRLAQQDDAPPIVGLNYKDERPAAKRWLRNRGDPYVFSLVDVKGDTGIDWGVYGVPETFIIDGSGRIRYKHIGPLTEQDLETEVRPILERLRQENV
jgi:cytochrome c biogenesis protein CcmG/thiol:disulfide interchange protein DsbE